MNTADGNCLDSSHDYVVKNDVNRCVRKCGVKCSTCNIATPSTCTVKISL